MTVWTVYKVDADKPARFWRVLGEVDAPHQPAALLAAFKRWQRELDPRQVQAGLTVRRCDPKRSRAVSLHPTS